MSSIFRSLSQEVVVITEGEFDAMHVSQETKDLCTRIALGGAQKRPDPSFHQMLLT